MFVVRKLINDKLYSTETDGNSDSFTDCFLQWQDPLHIRSYLLTYQTELQQYFKLGVKEATKKILKESEQFYSDILNIAQEQQNNKILDKYIFEPLHKNDDFTIPLLSTKAYGQTHTQSFLRLYAIRFKDGSYLVIGGLIKLHRTLQETEEGKNILDKFNIWKAYLHNNNIDNSFDLGTLIIDN
jgi:hypothetical protein